MHIWVRNEDEGPSSGITTVGEETREVVDLRDASVWVEDLWERWEAVELRVDTRPGILAIRLEEMERSYQVYHLQKADRKQERQQPPSLMPRAAEREVSPINCRACNCAIVHTILTSCSKFVKLFQFHLILLTLYSSLKL